MATIIIHFRGEIMRHSIYKISLVFLFSILLIGCNSVNPYTGEQQSSRTTVGASIGAVGGVVAGALMGGERGALIGGAVGAAAGSAIGHSMDRQDEELRKTLVGTGVQVKRVGNTIQLIMASDVTFATNQDNIQPSFFGTLRSVATVLKKYNQTTITVTGYTDNTGGDAYNQQLSEDRANSVADFLIQAGISPNRVHIQGMGKRHPIASNATVAGRAANRRVVISIRATE